LTFFKAAPKYRLWFGTLVDGVLPLQVFLIESNYLGEARMKFRPLGDRVVVRRIKEDTKTAGGIIIPETAQEKPQEGEIISVGPGAVDEKTGKRTPLEVKPGDSVLFGKWSGTEVKIDGEELLIMKESDIMGVIEGRKAKK
jgi:chaperonin GroES